MSGKQEKDCITTILSQWNSPRISGETRLLHRSKTPCSRNRRLGHLLWIIQIYYYKVGQRKQIAQGFAGLIETCMDICNLLWGYREQIFDPHPAVQRRLVIDY